MSFWLARRELRVSHSHMNSVFTRYESTYTPRLGEFLLTLDKINQFLLMMASNERM